MRIKERKAKKKGEGRKGKKDAKNRGVSPYSNVTLASGKEQRGADVILADEEPPDAVDGVYGNLDVSDGAVLPGRSADATTGNASGTDRSWYTHGGDDNDDVNHGDEGLEAPESLYGNIDVAR